MNPSHECMRRAREDSRAELLEMRRWDVSRQLKALQLPESGSHDMLSRIARVIYPTTTGWTREACEYLRDHLAELIGGERDAQRGCSGGANTCNHSHEQTPFVGYDVLGNERHKAVCELEERKPILGMTKTEILGDLGKAVTNDPNFDPSDIDHLNLMWSTLIHLLGGDQIVRYPENCDSGDEPEDQNDNAIITSELREYLDLNGQEFTNYKDELIATISGGTSALYAIADRIDEQYEVTQKQIADLERECESLQAMVERRNVKCRTYRCHIDQMKGGSKRWREKCAKLEEENRVLKAALSCLEVDFKRIRSLASQIIDRTHDKETAANE